MGRIRIHSSRVLVDGYELHFLEAGQGPQLVIIANMLVLARSYTPLIRTLARSFRVTVVEMPGSGFSVPVTQPLSMETHARVALHFIDKQHIQRAIVIGHSNSGPVAMLLALLAPERVERLVLVDSIGVVPKDHLARVLLARGWDGFLETGLSLTAAHHLLWNVVRHSRSFLHQVQLAASADLREVAHRIAVPTLLAWGKRDHTMPKKYGNLFRWHLDRGQFVIGPGSHDWLITDPKAFTKLILQSLADPTLELPRYDRGTGGLVRTVLSSANNGETALLRRIVGALSVTFGERHPLDEKHHRQLERAAAFIRGTFAALGFEPERQQYVVRGRNVENVIAEIPGVDRPDEIVVIGAHYDTVKRSPGANDNGSGVALLLALARRFATGDLQPPDRTVRLVAFSTEEPPFTRTERMGSWQYAERCRAEGEKIVAMVSLETLGTHASGLVAAVSNVSSRLLGAAVARSFGSVEGLEARHFSVPTFLRGANSSDHWSFWQHDYPAVMLTDGGPLRDRHYHRSTDTVEHVDFERLRRVLDGVTAMVESLAGTSVTGEIFHRRPPQELEHELR